MTTIYKRWDIHHRLQHIFMAIGFVICAVTGLPIKFHQASISLKISAFFGGYDGLILWHKIGAVTVLAVAVYHLIYLVYLTIKGQNRWSMVPTLQDGKDIINGFKHSLGLINEKPQFDRYSWKEKFDYLAVFWGMLAIGATGIIMWIPDIATQYIPRWVIDCMRMAHSDEAVLAVTFIAFWHFYNVHFSADIFPCNKVFLTGTMTEEEMKHEHPLELAKLKAQEITAIENCQMLEQEDLKQLCEQCSVTDKCTYGKGV